MVKNLPANTGDTGSTPGSGRSLGEGNGLSSILAGKACGQRHLVGYSRWAHKGSDMTKPLNNHNRPISKL